MSCVHAAVAGRSLGSLDGKLSQLATLYAVSDDKACVGYVMHWQALCIPDPPERSLLTGLRPVNHRTCEPLHLQLETLFRIRYSPILFAFICSVL